MKQAPLGFVLADGKRDRDGAGRQPDPTDAFGLSGDLILRVATGSAKGLIFVPLVGAIRPDA
jgi:hypothetical protein